MQVGLVGERGQRCVDVVPRCGEDQDGVGRAVPLAEGESGGGAEGESSVLDGEGDLQLSSAAIEVVDRDAGDVQRGVFLSAEGGRYDERGGVVHFGDGDGGITGCRAERVVPTILRNVAPNVPHIASGSVPDPELNLSPGARLILGRHKSDQGVGTQKDCGLIANGPKGQPVPVCIGIVLPLSVRVINGDHSDALQGVEVNVCGAIFVCAGQDRDHCIAGIVVVVFQNVREREQLAAAQNRCVVLWRRSGRFVLDLHSIQVGASAAAALHHETHPRA